MAELRGHPLGELGVGVDPGADGRPADGQLGQRRRSPGSAGGPRARPARRSPRTPGPSRIGTASWRWVRPILTTWSNASALAGQELLEVLQDRDQLLADPLQRRDVDGGGDHVVGRLPHVHGVVGVDRASCRPRWPVSFSLATPGDHLVGVHVRRGARAGLEDVDDELVVVLPVGDGLGGLDDRRPEVGVEQAEVHVDLGRGLLDQAHRPDQGPGGPERADLEIQLGPAGLGAVVGVGRDLHGPHRILLGAERRRGQAWNLRRWRWDRRRRDRRRIDGPI